MRSLSCWVTLALTSICFAAPDAFLTRPDIHGNSVVFTAEGDLWVANLTDGQARRMTSDPGVERNAHFSPDGSMIAFTAGYDGGAEVYVIPVSGGSPKRLTFEGMPAEVIGWSPDGQSVIYRTAAKMLASYVETFSTHELFTVPIAGGVPTKLPVPRGSYASMNKDGNTLAYVPASNEWQNWFRYEAGEADKIWVSNLQKHTFEKLTDSKGVDTQPTWVGNTLYFVSERSGVRNLWRLDPATKKVKQITFSTDAPVRNPSSDGSKVVFELGPKLAVYDPASGTTKTLAIQLNSDQIHARPLDYPVAGANGFALGPTGKRVALEVRGHLVTVPAGEGILHSVVSDSGQRVQGAAWSPDGKQIAYVSDASGEEQVWLVDATDGATPKQLTKTLKGEHGELKWSPDGKLLLLGDRDTNIQLIDATTGSVKLVAHSEFGSSYDDVQGDYTFSPDSKWVAYSLPGDAIVQHVYLFNIAKATSALISDQNILSGSPTFSPDGKYLYMLQMRNLGEEFEIPSLHIDHTAHWQVTALALAKATPSPFAPKNEEENEPEKKPEAPAKDTVIDLDGLADRTIEMKVPAGDYQGLTAVSGRLLLQAGPTLQAFDIASKTLTPLASGVRKVEVSHDGKKLLVVGPGGPQVVDVTTGPIAPTVGALKLAGLTVSIDPRKEWRQIFEETWRVGRDFFYDPNTHGVNWTAINAKYAARLPLVGDRSDLTQIQKDMISELNTGHCYVGGPSPYVSKAPKVGYLGADYVWDPSVKAYKITRLLTGEAWSPDTRSPLTEPGVNAQVGDYIWKIGSTSLTQSVNPASLLLGTAGHTISLTFGSKPSLTEAKTVSIIPLANEAQLRFRAWVNGRRDYVEKATQGQLGYVYVPDMETMGAVEFAKGYYPNVNKAGIIVDVRGNGGGNISANLLSDLATKPDGFFSFRSGGVFRRQQWGPMGMVVAVTDEWAFSDGEYFSEFFKRMKIGPLVGHRTGGGEVGSGGGYALMDGGSVYIPNYGAWVAGENGHPEWVVEGRGAVPDYEVDQDPESVMAGKDPQLDKAIQLILDHLKKHPFKMPQHPPFPVKTGGSRGS